MFYPHHPMLVPHSYYYEQAYPVYLQKVVQFVGSHYVSMATDDSLRKDISVALSTSDDKSPHMVQALVLMSIVLHARYDVSEAALHLARQCK